MDENTKHEISNYLHQIIGYAGFIQKDTYFYDYAKQIEQNAFKIDALLTDAAMDKSFIDLDTKTIDLNSFSGFNVLVVDDLVENIHIMQNIFLTLGCTVQSAQNGEEALDLVKQGFVPKIVCMDIIMPGMNGVEATQELKSLGLQAYFIAVSAFKDHSDDVVSPFDAWLPKPFTMEHIIGVLAGYEHNNILNRRQNSITVSLSDISAHTKQVLADYAREGAYTALENELSLLPESPSKDILLNLLKKMDLDAMIETIVSS